MGDRRHGFESQLRDPGTAGWRTPSLACLWRLSTEAFPSRRNLDPRELDAPSAAAAPEHAAVFRFPEPELGLSSSLAPQKCATSPGTLR